MPSSILVVLPIFALILTGWLARRSGALGATATRELNRFVVYLALPALLFNIMVKAEPAEIWQPDFIIAFIVGCALVFGVTLWVRVRQGCHLADAAIDGLNASYPNTGFMGFPLVLAVAGSSAMGATMIATILTTCVLFAAAIVLIECALQTGARRRDILRKTVIALVRNPMLVAPALGAAIMLSGYRIPEFAGSYLDLLGGAASPCALVTLGLFMAENAGKRPESGTGVQASLITLKLVVQPALTWVIAVPILALPAGLAHIAVLLAALPTGTGPFMLAEFYQREALMTGRVVLMTTLFSVASISLYLAMTPK